MHELVFDIASVWLTALIVVSIVAALFGSATARILFVDLVALLVVAILLLRSAVEGVSYLIDAALALALLSFVGTLVAARFRGIGRIFGDR